MSCTYVYTKGKNEGKACGKKTAPGKTRCLTCVSKGDGGVAKEKADKKQEKTPSHKTPADLRAEKHSDDVKLHKLSVKTAQKENEKEGKRGSVCTARLVHRFDKTGVDKKWPLRPGYMNVNITSGCKHWRGLSPMHLGPIRFFVDSGSGQEDVVFKRATCLENAWQFLKVWPGESCIALVDSACGKGEVDGKKVEVPNEEWFERRDAGFADPKPHRRVKLGKGVNSNAPEYSYYLGERLSYGEARKRIYCPLYEKYVVKTDAFEELNGLLDSGYNIQLLEYDARPCEDMKKEMEDVSKPFGHGLVLRCILEDLPRPWKD